MRMPFSEFITSGDLKFIVLFTICTAIAGYHFFKKLQTKKSQENQELAKHHNLKIYNAAFWIGILSVLSLLLGLMHSFYFIGKTGGIAPELIFQGISNTLITPVLGICLFIICRILHGISNSNLPAS
ncbi:MotA/TolQ/ExbB proton channel family protein [Aquimarina sp. Aq78]|uniref:MotA/TolQ/ExbB proton channel family protein n=1 Tax=Aquimarina sp. Aq78 TaxID=1191889 RepID=UPI00131BBA9F|nr:MotA/TolQ/ExbB proton channel family protein [Aquimarina sp. Aq78]